MDELLKTAGNYLHIAYSKINQILEPTVKSLQPHLQQNDIFIDDELLVKFILGITVFVIILTLLISAKILKKSKKSVKSIPIGKKEEIIVEQQVTPLIKLEYERPQHVEELITESQQEPKSPQREPKSPQKDPKSPQKEVTSPQKEAVSPQKEEVEVALPQTVLEVLEVRVTPIEAVTPTKLPTIETPGEVDYIGSPTKDAPQQAEPPVAREVERATTEVGAAAEPPKEEVTPKKKGRQAKTDENVEDQPQGSDTGDNDSLDDGVDDESADSEQKRYPPRTRRQPDRFTESAIVPSTPEKKKKAVLKARTPKDNF